MSSRQELNKAKSAINPHKLYVILEFTHYQKHTTFTMDGADYKNKKIHEGVRVLVAVRA